MANDRRPAPTRRTGGRGAPKGGPSSRRPGGPDGPAASTRYTPPTPRSQTLSAPWVPWVMIGLIILGVAVIFLHYVDAILPGVASNWWILGGLGFILGGILTATRYR